MIDIGKRAAAMIALFYTLTANAQQAVTIQGQKHPSDWFKA